MADITIGQYYPINSLIHKLDPRVKLFGTMIFIFCLFAGTNLVSYTILTVSLLAIIKMSKIPFKRMIKGMKGVLFILLFSAVLNLFFTHEGKELVVIGEMVITSGGIIKMVFIAIRLIFLVLGTSIMTLATKPSDLSDGLEKALGFLNNIKVPVHEMAMMMSLALRFIPTFMEETEKIMKAQKARGADFESGNVFKRVKNYLPLLIPLFVSAFGRALELAVAMEARCYNGGNRTKMKPLIYERRDYVAYLLISICLLMVVTVNVCLPQMVIPYV